VSCLDLPAYLGEHLLLPFIVLGPHLRVLVLADVAPLVVVEVLGLSLNILEHIHSSVSLYLPHAWLSSGRSVLIRDHARITVGVVEKRSQALVVGGLFDWRIIG
jgi:hypothetical protein